MSNLLTLPTKTLQLDANGALPLGYDEARLYAARAVAQWLNELPEMPPFATADFSIDLTEIVAQAFMQKLVEIQGSRRR
jgi:hypothetical protein